MKTVWKIRLYMAPGRTVVVVPKGFVPLHADTQNGDICVWGLVDPDEREVEGSFDTFGTGHMIPSPTGNYVGTVMDGEYVWHVFWNPPH